MWSFQDRLSSITTPQERNDGIADCYDAVILKTKEKLMSITCDIIKKNVFL